MLVDTLLIVRDTGRLVWAALMTALAEAVESRLTRCIGRSAKYAHPGPYVLAMCKLCNLAELLWRLVMKRYLELTAYPDVRPSARPCRECDE